MSKITGIKSYTKAELDEPKTAYICGVYFQHELKDIPHTVKLFKTVEALKSEKKCWKECGIVKLEIRLAEWIEPQAFGK